MNKLNELIQKLCPDGVVFKELREISEMKRGTSVTKKDVTIGDIPVISGGREPAYYCNTFNRTGETITVAGSGAGAGFVQYWTIPIFVCDAFTVKGRDGILTKYLYYCLTNMQERIYSTKKGGGVPHVHISSIENFRIPVPPLPLQNEIVRMLDTFTELTEELTRKLTAELTARRQQYEYYNNMLLSFDNAKYHTLEDLCEIVDYRGKTPRKVDDGIFLVTAKNIRKGFIDYDKSKEYISPEDYEEVMRRGFPKIGDVLITTEAPCGNVAQIDNENIALAQRVIKYRPKSKNLNSSFLKYVLLGKEFQDKLERAATGGTVKGIKGSKLHQLTIPVPPIEEQERIVAILNQLDALYTDLSIGLPTEIEVRQKQYEYYRDKLLTFEEYKGNAG